MGAIEDIFGKKPIKIELHDIDNLVKQRTEERRDLEYKGPDILGKPEQLSQWISAFLNADGGLIIIGVCEDDPNKKNRISAKIYPTRIEFCSNEYTKERVEQLIFSNIRYSSKPDIRIYPIRDPDDSTQAIYLVEIPQGDIPPYQAADGKYYRKLNATKYTMPHSEIADFFGRRRKPKLVLTNEIIKVDINESWFDFRVFVINEGKAAAKYARVIISFDNLDIMKVMHGSKSRIDELRGNVPTLQWDYSIGVLHATEGRTRIWDLRLKVKNINQACIISGEAIAEDMDMIESTYQFNAELLNKAKTMLDKGERPCLKQFI
jgi:hypothetical protein